MPANSHWQSFYWIWLRNEYMKKEHYESVSPKIQLSLYEDTEKKKKRCGGCYHGVLSECNGPYLSTQLL